jgi:ABC-type nickel/cobalt efflux system permease component RcnA
MFGVIIGIHGTVEWNPEWLQLASFFLTVFSALFVVFLLCMEIRVAYVRSRQDKAAQNIQKIRRKWSRY